MRIDETGSGNSLHQGRGTRLRGLRTVVGKGEDIFPPALEKIANPPNRLYIVGDPHALQEGIAIVGARKATPYGIACARRFAHMAASRGVVVVSGGARGCDAAAHEAALEAGTPTVVFLGGGCDELYPAEHHGLFQRIVDAGGAIVSEHTWNEPPLPYRFRTRNRLIAGLSSATLIVEAGLPSGTFSTADEALAANRDVLVVPGSITSPSSRGANRLLCQGATPVVDDETFEDILFSLFGCMRQTGASVGSPVAGGRRKPTDGDDASSLEYQGSQGDPPPSFLENPLIAALRAEPLALDELYTLACEARGSEDTHAWLMECLVEAEGAGLVSRYPDGRWGPARI